MNDETRRDIVVEQYMLGELPEKEMKEVESSPDLMARVSELEQSNKEILNRYPAEDMAERIITRFRQPSHKPASLRTSKTVRFDLGRFFQRFFYVPAFAVLAIVFGLLLYPMFAQSHNNDEPMRMKGLQPTMHVYRESGSDAKPQELKAGETVRQGDVLQLSYVSGGAPYGVIFSVDSRGNLTLHFPETENTSPALKTSGEVPLPFAYRLDDAPRFEAFYFVTSQERFSVADLTRRVKAELPNPPLSGAPSLALSDKYRVASITLQKGRP